jgi:FkbM family methyltransferase
MLESLHRVGSRIRNAPLLKKQAWLWNRVEPVWQLTFGRLAKERGYATRVNDDVFRLEYEYGARYDRNDRRIYEPSFYGPFVDRIRPGMTVFDIGAHIGLFALGAARRVGHQGRVVAFEPAPETVSVLERHVAFNGFRDIVEVLPMVVSDSSEPVSFFVYHQSMAASMSRHNVEDLNPEQRDTPAQEVHVPALTLDTFCRERGMVPDVLKIDVEGAEYRVLLGARELLAKHDVTVLCEIHPLQMANCGGSVALFDALVHSLGYRIEPLDEPNPAGIYHGLIVRGPSAGAAPAG